VIFIGLMIWTSIDLGSVIADDIDINSGAQRPDNAEQHRPGSRFCFPIYPHPAVNSFHSVETFRAEAMRRGLAQSRAARE
jgi:hypothetical protein